VHGYEFTAIALAASESSIALWRKHEHHEDENDKICRAEGRAVCELVT